MTLDRNAALDLIDFVDASPSPYYAAAEALRRLTSAGFTQLPLAGRLAVWPAAVDGGPLFAWVASPAPRITHRSGCWARTPTAPRCGCGRARTSAGRACASSAWRSTVARC